MSLAALITFGISAVLGSVFWLAGQLSGLLSGNGWPASSPADILPMIVRLIAHPGAPTDAWPKSARASLGPVWLIFILFLVCLVILGVLATPVVRFGLNWRRRREWRLFRLGFASGWEVRRLLGRKAVLAKARSVRPSVADRRDLKPTDVGFYLGRDRRSREKLYGSLEDVFIILAPPRQGKDVHFCAPYTIDAPGPCVVTSTRADAFTNTYAMRAKLGRVHVFDPNGMTQWPEKMRWSPLAGCEDPIVAQGRSSALVLGSGLQPSGDGSFYVLGSMNILRCLVHAAAVGGRTITDVQRWSTQPLNPEPVNILNNGERTGQSAPGWASALESYTLGLDPRNRGPMFANINLALSSLADPKVLRACSPGPAEAFDLQEFLSGQNTLYILGKEQKTGSVAPVVTAMMEDIFDRTRKIASRMPGSRLDPPLTIELNEAAHIAPLPNLPAYMGDSGGFSIALHVYLQSLSQARSQWGDNEAMIMWDNAAIRVIMGGAGNVDDLDDVSRLMGDFKDKKATTMRGGGGDSIATSTERRRVLSLEEVRTLPFGRALIVARAARPVEAILTPWWKRRDASEIGAGKAATEQRILRYVSEAEQDPTAGPELAGPERPRAGEASWLPRSVPGAAIDQPALAHGAEENVELPPLPPASPQPSSKAGNSPDWKAVRPPAQTTDVVRPAHPGTGALPASSGSDRYAYLENPDY